MYLKPMTYRYLFMYEPTNRLNSYGLLHGNQQIIILVVASRISPLVHPYLHVAKVLF